MKTLFLVLMLTFAGIAFAGCVTQGAQVATAKSSGEPPALIPAHALTPAEKELVISIVRASLKDPDSGKFGPIYAAPSVAL
jgi:hypothetical protein